MKNEYCTIFCNMLLLDKLIRTSFFIVCQKICDFSTLYSYFRSKIQYISRIVSQYFGIYIIWVLIHYMSAHIYTKICVPSGLFGFVLSFILTPSPYCYTLWIPQDPAKNNSLTIVRQGKYQSIKNLNQRNLILCFLGIHTLFIYSNGQN